MGKNVLIQIICSLLVILFIYTGLNKMMEFTDFRQQMERSPFIDQLAGFIAATLPPGEILVAFALVTKRFRMVALYVSLFMMALFTGYIWMMLTYAPDLPCTCGGIISKMSWKDHLIFNGAFTLLTIAGILLQSSMPVMKSEPPMVIA